MNEEGSPKECSACSKSLPRNRLLFSYCYNDWLCLNCHKNQFTPTQTHPIPIRIKSYRNNF